MKLERKIVEWKKQRYTLNASKQLNIDNDCMATPTAPATAGTPTS